MKKIVSKKSNSQSGFSLVELMIVVAIIGILSSIAVPQFQKFIFKARQTEAKTGLAALYTAEKAYYGEWSQYDTGFSTIGYKPEGKYFYNIGFGSSYDASNDPATSDTITNICTGASVNGSNVTGAACMASAIAIGVGGSCTDNTFNAEANSQGLGIDGADDKWYINETKSLNNGTT